MPIEVEGPLARHVLAFARILGDEIAVTVVCRLTFGLLADDGLSIQRLHWNGTRLRLPPEFRSAQLRDALGGMECRDSGNLAAILSLLPIVLLHNGRDAVQ